jgi:hypothetical protein
MEQDVDEVTIENNYVTREVPPSIDSSTGKLYPEDEKILDLIHFQKIPFELIGLQNDTYRKNLNK